MLKIMSKVLVNRIRPLLDSIIGPLQSSFIPRKGTRDNDVVAQEIVHYMHLKNSKYGYFLFKIEFEKACGCAN